MLGNVESGPPSARVHSSGASSILVVDDERASGELMGTLLRSQGYIVQVLHDGPRALSLIARGGIDLLVVDLMMAKLDGVEVCAHIRNELHQPFLPVIITTSLHDRESRVRAKEAGADDLMVKPIDGLELLVRIESLLRARQSWLSLERERERLAQELTAARAQLQSYQRMVRTVESATEEMGALIGRQQRELELVRRRWPNVPEVRDHLARFTETTVELQGCVDCLEGTRTVARLPDGSDVAGLEARSTLVRLSK